jgi:hypothetical protein
MTRTFSTLAAVNALFLLLSYFLGVASKLRDGVHNPSDQTFWFHFLVGLTTAMLTLLVHCLIFTYFLGTGRWVKEVKLAYDLPDEPLPKLTRDLKRGVFPPALFAMLAVIFTGMVGAAAQVGVLSWLFHATLATLSLVINAWAFRLEYRCLQLNAWLLEEVMEEVNRLRAFRGLPTNEEALQQERA